MQRIALLLAVLDHQQQRHEQDRHRGEHRPALARVPDHAAEGVGERRRDEQDRQHLQQVRQRGRILVRVGGVGVEEAAAVGAELLDALLGGDRTHRQSLGARAVRLLHGVAGGVLDGVAGGVGLRLLPGERLECGHVLVGAEVLDDSLRHQRERQQQRQRQQHVQRRARQVDPEVADGARAVPRQAADQRDRHHDAAGGRQEVLHREPRHLREVAHGRLAGVALPVGIGDEAHRGVEGRVGREGGELLRVERQPCLQALQHIHRERAERIEQQQPEGVSPSSPSPRTGSMPHSR